MPSASTIRLQIETALAHRIPSALTPRPKVIRPAAPTGIAEIDALLEGGLPVGALTEMVGPESSGRTAVALSFVSRVTRSGSVCAWIDVCDALSPESAAEAGVDLSRVLWVRCGIVGGEVQSCKEYKFAVPDKYMVPAPVKKGMHSGGCGGHPRNEVKGMAGAIDGLLRPETIAPRCAELQRRVREERETFVPQPLVRAPEASFRARPVKPWARIEQALRVTDLLLQAGGFSAIVLDMAGIAAEYVARVPLATWFRYRAAAERTQASVILLTQHPCAKSSGELMLRFMAGEARRDEATVFTGIDHRVEVERRSFIEMPANVVPLRKPPQRASTARWHSQSSWAGVR
jgi:RecA/RadA recombinase